MARTVLVTGGAGFIGSHTVDLLIKQGYSVKILDNLSSGNLGNIQEHLDSGRAELIEGDIRDDVAVKESLKDINAVAHFAALVSVPLSVKDPELTFDINLNGTANLLKHCAKMNVARFVFISSCSVLGDPEVLPVTEELKTNPISPYAESKLLGERYTLGFSQRSAMQTLVLRFFNVYGPRQTLSDYSGVITRFMDCCFENKPLTIYGDGSQTRDFVNVEDVARAVVAGINSEFSGEIFNVASGHATSISTLAKTIIKLANQKIDIRYEDERCGDIMHSYADISKTREFLGFEAAVSLKEGLLDLIKARSTGQ